MKVQIPYVKLWNWSAYCRTILYGSGKLTEDEYTALNGPMPLTNKRMWRFVAVFLFGIALGFLIRRWIP